MKIDLLYGPDFDGEKLAEELEELGYTVSESVIEFKDIRSMEKDIRSTLDAGVVVAHCFPATVLLDRFDDVETIAIDPPGIEDSEQKIEIEGEKQRTIWSSVNSDSEVQFDTDHLFTDRKDELAEQVDGLIDG